MSMSITAGERAVRNSRARPRILAPAARWLGHLVEMVLVMLIGMGILFGEFAAVANSLGYSDAMVQLPELSTAVMALTMAVPMALWMDYRGHDRRGIVEMVAAMIVPAVLVLAGGAIGYIARSDLGSTYHLWMYVAMVGAMIYRWPHYSRPMSHS
jgi:hypothetical protein